jgi:uncharacterized repeat protein (TIGR03943 family)
VAITGGALLAVALALVLAPGALHAESWSAWSGRGLLLTAPLLIALFAAPATFSAHTVMNREMTTAAPPASNHTAADETHFPVDETSPPMAVDVDYLLSAADDPDRRALIGGKIVQATGQFYPLADHEFNLTRLQIWCCAADATPLNVAVTGGDAGVNQPSDWVTVTGETQFRQVNAQWQPFLKLRKIDKAAVPADPYLYQSQ